MTLTFLLGAKEDIEREVFLQAANLLNLEVDLLYLGTTSTYFEVDDVAEEDVRQRGHSKDSRPDLPQEMGAGNTPDMNVIPEVKRDLAGWRLGRAWESL